MQQSGKIPGSPQQQDGDGQLSQHNDKSEDTEVENGNRAVHSPPFVKFPNLPSTSQEARVTSQDLTTTTDTSPQAPPGAVEGHDIKAAWERRRQNEEIGEDASARDAQNGVFEESSTQRGSRAISEDPTATVSRPGAVAVQGIGAGTASTTQGVTQIAIDEVPTTTADANVTSPHPMLQATLVKTHSATVLAEPDDEPQDNVYRKRVFRLTAGVFLIVVVVVVVTVAVTISSSNTGTTNSPFLGTAVPTTSQVPSVEPSLMPTSVPTTSLAPTQVCDISVQFVPPPQPELFDACEQRPYELGLKYVASPCAANSACANNNDCWESADNPLPVDGAYVIAYDGIAYDGNRRAFHEGAVLLSETILLRRGNFDRLPSDITVEIYPLTDNSTNSLRQVVTFHSSCSQPFLCFFIFGAVQIVSFGNDDQGQVSCLTPAPLTYNITLMGPAVEIVEAAVQLNSQTVSAPDLVGVILDPATNPNMTITLNVGINPTLSFTHTPVLTILTRTIGGGRLCDPFVFENEFAVTGVVDPCITLSNNDDFF